MGGLIESWNSFNDGLNSISKPIQMGPLWMQASHISGVPMNSNIWVTDPPASSYLACVAVKCVFLQSFAWGEAYLRSLREQLMTNGLNIALQSNLLKVAKELAARYPGFDFDQFAADLENDRGMQAFRTDLQEVRYKNISRFPTLILSGGDKASIITGYRTYRQLVDIIHRLNTNDAVSQGAPERK
jgi:predicted DsbA family dithiol-disulfide isomerase